MIREINGERYICLSPENEAKFKEAAMKRKDLRTSEEEWRATPQRKFEVPQAPKRIKVMSVLKILAVVIALVVLADSQMECNSTLGANSKYCVD